MQKRINKANVQQVIEKAGLTQTAIADTLGVSREAVSQWLNAKSFPRPNKLLQLGKLLNISFDELVIKEDSFAPKIAFRKRAGTKTKDHHVEKAQEIGRFLRHLVPYVPLDTLEMPTVLKSPSCEYDYLDNLKDERTLEKQELEQRFWEGEGVDWYVFIEQNVPVTSVNNIRWLPPHMHSYDLKNDERTGVSRGFPLSQIYLLTGAQP